MVRWLAVAQAEEVEAGREEVEVKEGEVQYLRVLGRTIHLLLRGFLMVGQAEENEHEGGLEEVFHEAVQGIHTW